MHHPQQYKLMANSMQQERLRAADKGKWTGEKGSLGSGWGQKIMNLFAQHRISWLGKGRKATIGSGLNTNGRVRPQES